ncbi:MAG: peptide ABC transporter substrate-binding protein [Armatimonadetes bacterium]|nr:hypothetical protein [Armatimonadota bacterium]MBS1702620.1 peptide ABC transporter substrate-binding protein [Armatimonadota bacterium]MBS1726050.1 peptide ABC transporter substrate-binding protein [Armatimonadota bacterium]
MRIGPVLAIGAALLTLIGCSGGSGGFSSRKADAKAGVFRYPLPTTPTSLDPSKVQDGDTIDVVQQVFEGLMKWDENNRAVPNLAESYDLSADKKTYTFHLKHGIKFSNGREVKAEDFKWCWERTTNPKFTSPTAGTYMADIMGVNDRLNFKGDGDAPALSGVTAKDDYTLEVTIDKPRPYFLDKLTYACTYVFAKEALPDPLKDMATPEQMIGTGPFKMDTVIPEQIVTLVANKDYHDGAPKLERIERPIIKDAQSRLNKYKTGEIDLCPLEREDLPAIQKDPVLSKQLKFFDRPAMYYLGMNCSTVPALKDRRVRQAIAMALDRDKIVNEVLGGINRRADSIIPPGVKYYREKTAMLPFDITKAKTLLAQAGFPDGKGFPDLDFCYRDGRPDVEIVAQAIQQQLRQNLGINLHPKKIEWGAYLQKYNTKTMPIYHMRWAADYLDPENFLSLLLASYGNENKLNYHNPAYDALCREADTSFDDAKRAELYAKAEDMVLQDAPFVPIYFQKDAELISDRVSGIRESAFGHLPHTTTSVQ